MNLKLRPYQQRLIDVALQHLHDFPTASPIIVAPTASGKSVIVAKLCEELVKVCSGMVLVLTHRRELVEQNAAKLPSHMRVGVYSAGLGRKELHRVTVAGFQSIRNVAEKLPKVSYILIDEAHFAVRGYREFIDKVRERSGEVRVIGLTATPYLGDVNRTALHLLPADKAIFTSVGAEVGMGELLRDGYLTPLIPYTTDTKLDTSTVKMVAGDFAPASLQAACDTDEANLRIAAEIVAIFAERNSVMVFCTGVEHTEHIRDALRALGETAEMVLGNTPSAEREKVITAFKAGRVKYMVACEVLLVGFDAPCVDGIANLRPSKSALIAVQLAGRGMRLFEGKPNCLLADFTDTYAELGPIDEVEGRPPKTSSGQAPVKICDACYSVILAGLRVCPVCGFEFTFEEHERTFDPNTGMLISGMIKNEDGTRTYPISDVIYEIRETRAGNPALVAKYMAPGRKSHVAEDWYNIWDHRKHVADRDSSRWLRRNKGTGASIPVSAAEALSRAEFGALKVPSSVTVKPGSPFPVRFGMQNNT